MADETAGMTGSEGSGGQVGPGSAGGAPGAGGESAHPHPKPMAAPVYVDWGERFHGSDSSILGTSAYKACCQCGIELNHRTRFKDSQGRYWCPECNAADRARHQPVPCVDCRTAFPRDQMKDDHGKLVCAECLEKRMLAVAAASPPKPAAAAPASMPAGSARKGQPNTLWLIVALCVACAGLIALAYTLL